MKSYLRMLSYFWILFSMPLAASTSLIYVLNDMSSTIHVIDPVTNKVVQTIGEMGEPHGVTFSKDGTRAYITSEKLRSLNVVETKTGKLIKKVPLSGKPNLPALSTDGQRVYICISKPGTAVDIIDTTSLERIKTLPMKGSMHDCYTTPDGKYLVAGSSQDNFAAIIDLQTQQIAWEIHPGRSVLTMAIERGTDGSARRIYMNQRGFRGFAVFDFATHKEVAKVEFPEKPNGFMPEDDAPTHGIALAPDGKILATSSRGSNAVFFYSVPELKLLGYVPQPEVKAAGRAPAGGDPTWVTFTADGSRVYVANTAAKMVSVIDVKTLKELTRIPVSGEGGGPERIATLVRP